MKRTLICVVAAMVLMSHAARADDFRRNAYGVYAAPVVYGFDQGSQYALANTGAGLDLGLYYARFFNESFSMRLEGRYGWRHMDEIVWSDLYGSDISFRLTETILEVPLVLQADRRIPISDHTLRVSVGGGLSYKFVLDQQLLWPGGDAPLTPADSYQKLGLLLDGGVTFDVDRKSAVFARLRLDFDVATMGEPADASVIRRFWATGFYAGFEYGF